MQIFEKKLTLQQDSLNALHTFLQDDGAHFCFFDIETTGLSPKVSSLYLIGALWCDGGAVHTKQWFADDYISEQDLLAAFTAFLSGFTTLVHYNGSGFDIPYIEKKCREWELPSPFENIKSLDLYREIRKLKSLLDTIDLKLSTIENLAGFMRKDTLTGKDCIQVYSNFMQKKYFRDNTMELERQKLLLHNIEDIIGTYSCARLLAYRCRASFSCLEEAEGFVHASFTCPCTFPFPAKHRIPLDNKTPSSPSYLISYENNHIQLDIPLNRGVLLHFYKNYKDYVYLPNEDTAIHKSVGMYVDKQFRKPARASNCYTKKEGLFLPLPPGLDYENDILFRTDYKSRQHYILWDDKAKQNPSRMEDLLYNLT